MFRRQESVKQPEPSEALAPGRLTTGPHEQFTWTAGQHAASSCRADEPGHLRPDASARLGLTAAQISKRWANCHPKTAYNRLDKAGFKPVRFNSRTTLFRLSDVKSVERAGMAVAEC